jgi:hypothetical protein
MAVKRIHSIENYRGLSTDTKPIDAVVGSTFWEYDTKNFYVVYDKVAGIAQWALRNDDRP